MNYLNENRDASVEQKIKDYVRSLGVEVVGLAGPERLKDGPPSLDVTYTLKGAKSIVSMIIPMDKEPVYQWFGKETPVAHHIDQIVKNQDINRISEMVAAYIRTLGYKAAPVPANSSYRRHPYIFAVLPSFSLRFGAMAAGIAVQGWSGNVMCEEYGGSTYIGAVVTDAVLKSDPLKYSPRHFIDGMCSKCKLCDKTCLLRMFDEEEEEYVYMNGALHPRGKRRDINMCNASCFGLHSISSDKKWSTWGYRWIKPWMNKPLDKIGKLEAMFRLAVAAISAGDSGRRISMIKAMSYKVQNQEVLKAWIDKDPANLSVTERNKAWLELCDAFGVPGCKDDTLLTCGNCGLVCGENIQETSKRYHLLMKGGIVMRKPDRDKVVVPTFEEAAKKTQMPKKTFFGAIAGGIDLLWYFHKHYFGLEPKSMIQGWSYKRREKKAIKNRIQGHKDFGAGLSK